MSIDTYESCSEAHDSNLRNIAQVDKAFFSFERLSYQINFKYIFILEMDSCLQWFVALYIICLRLVVKWIYQEREARVIYMHLRLTDKQ